MSSPPVATVSRDGTRVLLVVRSILERVRTSLFAVPMVWVVVAVVLSQVVTRVDRGVSADSLPSFTDTTVDSARAILGAISSGTIGAASVVFSLTLVAIQMSSSVYTSRVLRSFLRDRFQQHMIGVLLATFTYSLLVLREVRGPLESVEEGGEAYIPRLSVFLAVVFAIIAVLALLASISHTSQSLRASSVAQQLVDELVTLIRSTLPERSADDDVPSSVEPAPTDSVVTPAPPGAVLTSVERGWIQQVSLGAIRDAVGEGSRVRIEHDVGSYVFEGLPLVTVWPPPSPDDLETTTSSLRGAFAIAEQRSLQQDIAFGFVMIEDIANKALSPGVNDPNTAIAVLAQLGEAVLVLLERELPPAEVDLEGCRLVRANVLTYRDYVGLAFDQIRHFSADQPAVQLALTRTLVGIGDELERRSTETPEALDALRSMLQRVQDDLGRTASSTTSASTDRALDLVECASWMNR